MMTKGTLLDGLKEVTSDTEIMVDGVGNFIDDVQIIDVCDCDMNFGTGFLPVFRVRKDTLEKNIFPIRHIRASRRLILLTLTTGDD